MTKKLFLGILVVFLFFFANSIYKSASIINKAKPIFHNIKDDAEIIRHGPIDKKVVAITFDDGPHPRYTPQILELLKKYDAKATFFVIGKHVSYYPDTLKKVAKDGHEIGNHTYSHVDVGCLYSQKIKEEIEKTQDIIYSTCGVKSKIFRPPFGHYNKCVRDILQENRCKIILWTPAQDPKDWNKPGAQKIANSTISKIKNGDIILLHDYADGRESQTVEALKIILPELKKRGYKFVKISELLDKEELKVIKKSN